MPKKKLDVTKLFRELNERDVEIFLRDALEQNNLAAVKAVLASGVAKSERCIRLLNEILPKASHLLERFEML